MYQMKADGVVFYDSTSDDVRYQIISPKIKYEMGRSDMLQFTVPPGNEVVLRKLITIVTVEQDGTEIFRGRVLETASDFYNKMEVYCEGELSFLLDSLVRPYNFDGKAVDLFRQLVESHNEQVEEGKHFEVGIITAIDNEDTVKTESAAYADTLAELRQMLVTKFDGYLRVRYENGVRYLDFVDSYDDNCGQAIEFGVNMMDIDDSVNATGVFSVLVPLGGYNTENKDPITIAKVNDGKDYIEDAEAIARYGRIVKTYKWEELTDPQEIMDKGLEHFKKMKEERTLTIKAVDLHVIDTSIDRIRVGSRVMLKSFSHGLTEPEVCYSINLNIAEPEKSEYTFGLPLEKLTDQTSGAEKKTSRTGSSGAGAGGRWRSNVVTRMTRVTPEYQDEKVMMADGSSKYIRFLSKVSVQPEMYIIRYWGK